MFENLFSVIQTHYLYAVAGFSCLSLCECIFQRFASLFWSEGLYKKWLSNSIVSIFTKSHQLNLLTKIRLFTTFCSFSLLVAHTADETKLTVIWLRPQQKKSVNKAPKPLSPVILIRNLSHISLPISCWVCSVGTSEKEHRGLRG